jgi:hypothetical protein
VTLARSGTLLLLTFLWTLLSPAVNAQSPEARLSVDEAQKLVDAALYPNKSKAVLEQIHNPYEPDFIFFEAIDPNPDHSAHMGTFAVNPWTGDVWSTAGSCGRLTSSRLIEMLKSIQARSKLAAAEFDRRRAKKPICDAD